jgi:lipopolysaccharide/colanic/teichoic acid biosynthesis glycosyltransferase
MINKDNNIKSFPRNDSFIAGGKLFWFSKRIFDIFFSLILLPIMILVTITLIIFNRFYNLGPVFFVQQRMGKDCIRFNAFKFRSMTVISQIDRKFNDPVEYNRITPLGGFLRRSRLDELPQIVNVLKGEMSLIGPRPDYYDHALIFLETVAEYRGRHIIRPGISGLSQIRLGYAEGLKATRKKSIIDCYYIKNAGFILDSKILFGTIITIFRRIGM